MQPAVQEDNQIVEPINTPINTANAPVTPKRKNILVYILVGVIIILAGFILYTIFGKYIKISIPNRDSDSTTNTSGQKKTSSENADSDSTSKANDEEDSTNFDLFSDKYTKTPSKTNSNTGTNEDTSNNNTSNQQDNAVILEETYEEWKTYVNNEIGYMLKYPPTWEVVESSGYNEVIERNVKSIVIYSDGQKYTLFFGLKQVNDPFETSGRTGIGAGDFVTDGQITVLDNKIDVTKLVYENKTSEYFFPKSATYGTADKKYSFGASFSLNPSKSTGNENINNVPELDIVKKILASVQIIPRQGVFCPSQVTAGDNSVINNYSAFYNKTHKWFIRVPNDWTRVFELNFFKIVNPDNSITFDGTTPAERFQIKSGDDAVIEVSATWENIRNMDVVAACEKTMTNYYRRGNLYFLLTKIKHEGINYSILYGYTYENPEQANKLKDDYELLLRSFEFAK